MKYKLQYRTSKSSPWRDCVNRDLSITDSNALKELLDAAQIRATSYPYQYRVIEEVVTQKVHLVVNGGDPTWN